MDDEMAQARSKPPRVTGVAHVFAAAGYSLDGARRLWQEAAFRHELLLFPASAGLLWFLDASLPEYGALTCIFLLLVAVEAINTAIEVIVDHLAPDWQPFAKAAKDLGSLAVMCVLAIGGIFLASICLGRILAQ